jgi:hypothetical protein
MAHAEACQFMADIGLWVDADSVTVIVMGECGAHVLPGMQNKVTYLASGWTHQFNALECRATMYVDGSFASPSHVGASIVHGLFHHALRMRGLDHGFVVITPREKEVLSTCAGIMFMDSVSVDADADKLHDRVCTVASDHAVVPEQLRALQSRWTMMPGDRRGDSEKRHAFFDRLVYVMSNARQP